ncbi:MAG: phosphotransferase [Anaerolineales bacterium]|nr:phosphotransferase [Anaerolineales bacterium]
MTLEHILPRISHWQGKALTTSVLSGGITNQNFKVEVEGQSFVLRVGGNNTELLGIDRAQENIATRAAASVGIGPEVLDFVQPEGWLVTRFITGKPVPPPEMSQPENLRRVAQLLQRIHALPPITATFSPFRIVEMYDATARRLGVNTFPENYAWLRARLAEIEAAFLREPFAPRLCHNDLLNENFLDDGALRLIDWEYAGMGDVFFDLANFAVNHGLNDEQDQLLLDAYFAPATPRHRARHKLMKIASDFREAMWGVVQQGISQLDFDFKGYADKHFARMTENFNDARFAIWLGELNG